MKTVNQTTYISPLYIQCLLAKAFHDRLMLDTTFARNGMFYLTVRNGENILLILIETVNKNITPSFYMATGTNIHVLFTKWATSTDGP